jgi:hypothetical protein
MQTHEQAEEKKLWVVRYIAKSLPPESGNVRYGHAIYRGDSEAQVRQNLTAWLRQVLHEEVITVSIEPLPPDTLKPRTPRQPRKTHLVD